MYFTPNFRLDDFTPLLVDRKLNDFVRNCTPTYMYMCLHVLTAPNHQTHHHLNRCEMCLMAKRCVPTAVGNLMSNGHSTQVTVCVGLDISRWFSKSRRDPHHLPRCHDIDSHVHFLSLSEGRLGHILWQGNYIYLPDACTCGSSWQAFWSPHGN